MYWWAMGTLGGYEGTGGLGNTGWAIGILGDMEVLGGAMGAPGGVMGPLGAYGDTGGL